MIDVDEYVGSAKAILFFLTFTFIAGIYACEKIRFNFFSYEADAVVTDILRTEKRRRLGGKTVTYKAYFEYGDFSGARREGWCPISSPDAYLLDQNVKIVYFGDEDFQRTRIVGEGSNWSVWVFFILIGILGWSVYQYFKTPISYTEKKRRGMVGK